MVHEIHNSERKSFRSCRRRWNWAYREGYVPMEREEHFDFGIAVHVGMQVFYTPETWDTTDTDEKLAAAIQAFLLECERQKKEYLENHRVDKLPIELEDAYQNRLDLGTGMLNYHAEYIHPEFDNWFRPVAVEIPFEVPLIDPDRPPHLLRCFSSPQCGQNHSNDPESDESLVVYSGRVDVLVEDKIDKDYYIFDHKTAAIISANDDFLLLDDQIGGYCWALAVKLNLDIHGFIYAEMRKDFPRPPRLLKRPHKGCNFSTSKTQSTNIDVFEPYVARHDPEAFVRGDYDEYLEFLRSSAAKLFSQRHIIGKSDIELEHIGENIAEESADMVRKPRIYPNISRFQCRTCRYREPCIGTFRDEDVDILLEGDFIQTDRRHWMDRSRQEQVEEAEAE
jgi:hypothetical protein